MTVKKEGKKVDKSSTTKKVSKPKPPKQGKIVQGEQVIRVPLPKKGEIIGVVDKLLGNARMMVRCVDGKLRNCRVPGGKRRRLYIRKSDLVIVKPWKYEEDSKGDIVYKYRKVQVDWLRRKGYLSKLEQEF